jgi:hypothetical protein
MLQSFINSLFACTHRHTTFPLTPARRNAIYPVPNARVGTYVVCLDCGSEFAYNWEEMRVGEKVPQPLASPETQPSFR